MPRGVPNPKVNKATPKWFYLDGILHERIKGDRSADKLLCWNYGTQQSVIYSYAASKLRLRPAYTTAQVARMLNRRPLTMLRYIERGHIRPPAKGVREGKSKQQSAYRWSDDDVLNAHTYLSGSENWTGKNRKGTVPSRREVRALLDNEEVLYVMDKNGKFVPTWRAKEF